MNHKSCMLLDVLPLESGGSYISSDAARNYSHIFPLVLFVEAVVSSETLKITITTYTCTMGDMVLFLKKISV